MESVHFLLCLLIFVCALLIVNTISSTCPNIIATGETKPLYLLTLVPYPDSRNTARLEEGLGTIPGASVARDEINNRTNLLPGYHIELIVESTEACSHTETSSGLASLVKYTVSPPCHPVVAVAGLFCSSHTSVLSPVAGHEGYDLNNSRQQTHQYFMTSITLFHTYGDLLDLLMHTQMLSWL